MKRLALILIAGGTLALPAAAQAGCWATVGLSSLPKDVHAGQPWSVAITVKQHGRTLLPNAKPAITIADAAGAKTTVQARKTQRRGVYRANVVFPSAGRWTYTVFDGFLPSCASDHAFAPVTILPREGA
jgi:hypothetical protein